MDHHINGIALPNEAGFFGNYGGQFIPPHLKAAMDDIKVAYEQFVQQKNFKLNLLNCLHTMLVVQVRCFMQNGYLNSWAGQRSI